MSTTHDYQDFFQTTIRVSGTPAAIAGCRAAFSAEALPPYMHAAKSPLLGDEGGTGNGPSDCGDDADMDDLSLDAPESVLTPEVPGSIGRSTEDYSYTTVGQPPLTWFLNLVQEFPDLRFLLAYERYVVGADNTLAKKGGGLVESSVKSGRLISKHTWIAPASTRHGTGGA